MSTGNHKRNVKPPVESATLTPKQVAMLVGISKSHLYDLQRDGKLGPEALRLGKSVRWRRAEVLEWIAAGCPDRAAWVSRGSKA